MTPPVVYSENGSSLISGGSRPSAPSSMLPTQIATKAIIIVGGPSTDSWFRPLSMLYPKPLFPVAGRPLIYHHVEALSKLGPQLKEILLIGFYNAALFESFIQEASDKFNVSIRYLQEPKPLGTGGGLYLYRHEILRGGPKHIFVIYGDVGCSYPFDRLLRAHQEAPSIRATILATQVPREYATNYGCIVREPGTNIIQHYVEKPATFVSDFVSCGVFLLEASVLEGLPAEMPEASPSLLPPQQRVSGVRPRMIGLEQDILAPLAASRKVAAYETKDFWCQVKTASSAITANRLYLEDICFRYPERLAAGDKNGWSCEIIGAVWIDPTAVVHPDAKIGPNVSIGPGCEIGEGVRIRDSIVLDASQVGANSAILNSVVGWESRVGAWCRIEGAPDGAACETVTLNGIKMPSITILGGFVDVADEAIIRNCIVLPNKDLTKSYQNEILL